MAKSTTRKSNPPRFEGAERELIVQIRPQAAMRSSAGRFESAAGATVADIRKILDKADARMLPLFGPTEERIAANSRSMAETAETSLPDLTGFYRVSADDKKLDDVAESLAKQELVEAAYVKPPAEPPIGPDEDGINTMLPSDGPPPPMTADFSARQIYLDAAPAGIDARWAWTQAGGNGGGVSIIDIEGAWRFTHEDLTQNQGGVVGGTQINGVSWRDHGTAVLGEYSGDRNSFGITGISPDAIAMAVSHGGIGSAAAINQAAARLSPGDIILLEMHRPGPRHNFQTRSDQKGYIAVEWWPDDYAAILNATQRGIIIVEAAGNGAEDLDDVLYETPGPGFPGGWSNSFRRSNRDSGAIVVGAGAPPPGTHGRDHGPDRSRLGFSNYGDIVDCQGWGREVTTCGYGSLQGGADEDLWYTDTFSGTSSASPIVTGAIASLQGMAQARGRPVLTPSQLRNCLRTTGSPQQDHPSRPASQRIGTRPDMRALVTCIFGTKSLLKDFKDGGKDGAKEIKEREKILKEKERLKDLKDNRKDVKEKDTKERKEKELKEGKEKEKDLKEFKEGKEKDIFEGKRIENKQLEKQQGKIREGGGGFLRPDEGDGDTDTRLAALESAVGELTHFIVSELRPDLSGGGSPQSDAEAAKDQKDQKDMEKPSDA